ncbi:ImmA/IrrE family metallo-endopeptidase [Tropicimonas sediminicola]|uniref:ImmA/IrrE family metallo-endopeptidase n=1 Tax=Tropicimonas sediminicola TaxID=1031541 RepID=UPI000B782B0F|nr:ImmA/IrrE family metallo-endopeptidase [Tropicimonas sediminicola]
MIRLRDVMKKLPPDGGARHALRNFNLAPKGENGVPSVKELAETLGFEVERVELPRGMKGRLVPDSFAPNGFRIEVNETLDVLQQRWAALHEIGHYYLHVDRNDPFVVAEKFRDRGNYFYSDEELQEEREADQFAAAVLFDDGAFGAARSLLGDDDRRLSKHFGVTENVIRIARRQF